MTLDDRPVGVVAENGNAYQRRGDLDTPEAKDLYCSAFRNAAIPSRHADNSNTSRSGFEKHCAPDKTSRIYLPRNAANSDSNEGNTLQISRRHEYYRGAKKEMNFFRRLKIAVI